MKDKSSATTADGAASLLQSVVSQPDATGRSVDISLRRVSGRYEWSVAVVAGGDRVDSEWYGVDVLPRIDAAPGNTAVFEVAPDITVGPAIGHPDHVRVVVSTAAGEAASCVAPAASIANAFDVTLLRVEQERSDPPDPLGASD